MPPDGRFSQKGQQDKTRFMNLMHAQPSPKTAAKMAQLLNKSFDSLQPRETVFLVAFTVYRFRNNMFHGNKGVDSWLQYTEQIELCTGVMQRFVSHAEARVPSMKLPNVA